MNYVNLSECSWALSKDRSQVVIAAPAGHRICPRSMRLAMLRLELFDELLDLANISEPLLKQAAALEMIVNTHSIPAADRSGVFWRVAWRRLCNLLQRFNDA